MTNLAGVAMETRKLYPNTVRVNYLNYIFHKPKNPVNANW